MLSSFLNVPVNGVRKSWKYWFGAYTYIFGMGTEELSTQTWDIRLNGVFLQNISENSYKDKKSIILIT